MDTTNKFTVALRGEYIVFVRPPPGAITQEEALNLAAWLVALADPTGEEFPKLLNAIRNT